jgi:hypothetical protein
MQTGQLLKDVFRTTNGIECDLYNRSAKKARGVAQWDSACPAFTGPEFVP